MKIAYLTITIMLVLLNSLTSAQPLTRSVELVLNREKPLDLAAGVINTTQIKAIFLNDGNFFQFNSQSSVFNGLIYKKTRYFGNLDLWIGVPEGEWSPKKWDVILQDSVLSGPTVSGTFWGSYYFWRNGTDWGPVPGSRGRYFSGDFLLSDIYSVTPDNDLPLLLHNQFQLTWPENIYGERVWPGLRAIDATSLQILPDYFRADQEVVFNFTDINYSKKGYPYRVEYIDFLDEQLQGFEIGAKASGAVLAFNENYAMDFLFFDLKIVNTSRWNYKNVYLGLYCEPSIEREDIDRRYYDDNYFINYLLNDTNDQFNYNLAYYDFAFNPLPPNGSVDLLGIKLLKTPLASNNDGIDNDRDGQIDEPEGEQVGLSGWHWANTNGAYSYTYFPGGTFVHLLDHPLKRGELIQYKLLAGDTTGLLPIEQSRFFYSDLGNIDPNYDRFDKNQRFPLVPATLLSSGPFTWNSGDTVRFAFAVVFGENLEKLKSNCRVAQKIFDNDYLRMSPPQPPTVKAVAGDKKVTLYWDDRAERDVDFLTGYSDFEGYRIYRTSVAPALNQWGKPIHDGQGKLVGFLPLAQFDLVNDIQGLDPQYPHLYLGSNTGLRHSWSDTTVQNGVTYWYAVCAYDRGITADSLQNPDGWPLFRSLENSRGTDPDRYRNLVSVTPGTQPSNYQESGLTLIPLPGTIGNGIIRAIIMNSSLVTGHTYTIVFDQPPNSSLTYDVIDEDQGITVLQDVSQVNGEEGALFDGIRLSVTKFDQVAFWEQASGWITWESGDRSVCNYRYKVAPLSSTPPAFDYEIRFTSKGDTSALLRKIAPFEIWNLTQNQLIEWEIYQNAATDSTAALKSNWSSGDEITFREWIDDAWRMTWRVWLTRNPQFVYVERDTIIEEYRVIVYDTTIVDNAPQVGDAFRLITAKPFHSGDRFCLQTQQVASRLATRDDLSQVKVVPNPYLVSAGWELHGEDHRIAFTHLPARCEIIIFNVTGEVVAILKHDDLHSGATFWNLQSHEGMEVASGLYLYVVKTPEGKKKDGKFVVIR